MLSGHLIVGSIARCVLSTKNNLGTKGIANLWKVTDRAARKHLVQMINCGLIKRHAKSKNDPNATYSRT